MTTSQAQGSGFIGRQAELAVLTDALDDTANRTDAATYAGRNGLVAD